jgi:sugar/nucleoside kinase (ribokinase family)
MLLVVGGIFREIVIDDTSTRGRELRLAGSGLYAALAAARLGAEVALIAPVGGEDEDIARALCDEAGVQAVFLATRGASATFVVERDAGADPRPQYRPSATPVPGVAEGIFDPDVVLVFGHPEWDALQDPVIRGYARGRVLVFDGQGWLSKMSHPVISEVGVASCVEVINAEEVLARDAGEPGEGFAALPGEGIGVSVVKDGPWGVSVYGLGAARHAVAAYAGQVRQTIGSGDVFAGAFSGAINGGEALLEACETGARAAAAWIFGDAPLPGGEFLERVAGLSAAARLVTVAPERVRGQPATVFRSADLGSELLAREMRAALEQVGIRASENREATTGARGATVELAGASLSVDPGESEDVAALRERLQRFVAATLAEPGDAHA